MNELTWRKVFKEKIVLADEAVNHIKPENKVVIGHAVGEPSTLVDAMVKNKNNYSNVELIHMVTMGKAEYAKVGMENNFRHNSMFVGGNTRDAVASDRADFTPCFFRKFQEY